MRWPRRKSHNKDSENGNRKPNSYDLKVTNLPEVQATENVCTYTNVLDISDLSQSLSISTRETSIRSERRNKKKSGSNRVDDSLDKKILEAEAKVKSQIRQLASESFDYDDNGEFNNYNKEKRKIRLMTTAGVLLFDGLGKSKDLKFENNNVFFFVYEFHSLTHLIEYVFLRVF